MSHKSSGIDGTVTDEKPVTFSYQNGAFVSNETFIAYSGLVELAEGVEEHFASYVLIDPEPDDHFVLNYRLINYKKGGLGTKAFHCVLIREGKQATIEVEYVGRRASDPPVTHVEYNAQVVSVATRAATNGFFLDITAQQVNFLTNVSRVNFLATTNAPKQKKALLARVYIKVIDFNNVSTQYGTPVEMTIGGQPLQLKPWNSTWTGPQQRQWAASLKRWAEHVLGKAGRFGNVTVLPDPGRILVGVPGQDGTILEPQGGGYVVRLGVKDATSYTLSEVVSTVLHEMSLVDTAQESGGIPAEKIGVNLLYQHNYAAGWEIMYSQHSGLLTQTSGMAFLNKTAHVEQDYKTPTWQDLDNLVLGVTGGQPAMASVYWRRLTRRSLGGIDKEDSHTLLKH